jgi:hypothetical protein
MSKPPVPFAPETLDTIQRAFRLASDRRHDTVGLGICCARSPTNRRRGGTLATCGVSLDALRKQVDDVLAKGIHAGSSSRFG